MNCLETTEVLGDSAHLVATFVTPTPPAPGAPPVIALLTNSGVIPRAGPNRMNVRLSQQFAAQGIPSVRFDLSGLGDSGRSRQPLPLMEQWVADCRAVMDEAQARFGCNQFLMVGFCSGAEVAHLVALQDPRMRAALLWDMYAYPTLESRLRYQWHRWERVGWGGLWHKLRARALRWMGRDTGPAKPARPPAIPASPPSKEALCARLNRIVADGVILHFSFGEGNPHWFNHDRQFWAMFRGQPFLRGVTFRFLREADHLMTAQRAQMAFLGMTSTWVTSEVLPRLQRGGR